MSRSSIQNRQICEMPELVEFHSAGELDLLQEVASGASLEIVQLEPGMIHGELAHIELGLSSVHSNSFSLSARGRGATSDKRWTFLIFPHYAVGTFSGELLNPRKVLVYRPGSEFDGTTHGVFQDWIFTVDDAELRRVTQHLFRLDLPYFTNTCSTLYPDSQILGSLQRLAKSSLATFLESNIPFQASGFCKSLQSELTELLARLAMSGHTNQDRVDRTAISHSRIVRMSEDYLFAHLDTPITIAQLCAVVDVSERTLRNAYQSVLGLSPNAYVKARRLQMARLRLEQSTPKTATVTAIGLTSGFGHLGHFSQDYSDFFGERPSQTLAASSTD